MRLGLPPPGRTASPPVEMSPREPVAYALAAVLSKQQHLRGIRHIACFFCSSFSVIRGLLCGNTQVPH